MAGDDIGLQVSCYSVLLYVLCFVIVACAVGVVVICLALVIRHIQSTLFSISTVLFSIVIGPQAAVFFMALILPWVDWIVS